MTGIILKQYSLISGHTLKQLDIEFLRRVQDKVNVIPVIAKADTLTSDECKEFKKAILNELAVNRIHTFDFPDSDECTGTFCVHQLIVLCYCTALIFEAKISTAVFFGKALTSSFFVASDIISMCFNAVSCYETINRLCKSCIIPTMSSQFEAVILKSRFSL